MQPGSLDPTFGSDHGKFTTDGFFGISFANAVAVQSDGKIVVAGETAGEFGIRFAMKRYNTDGSLDSQLRR